MRRLLLFCLLCALVATPAAANIQLVDYLGYAWETGGIPPSNFGDVLVITAVASQVDPLVGADLLTEEVTLYAYNLVSTGGIIDGGGNLIVSYSGGTLEIWHDLTPDADWGVFPPNATSPSTFVGDSLLFQGTFTEFSVFLTPGGQGAYTGNLDGVTGSLIAASGCMDCGYTWGGAFTSSSGAQVPDGYDLQIDGVFELQEAVPRQSKSWGSLKALYGQGG